MSAKELLDMIENMQWDLKRMPIGRANEIAKELDRIKEYVKAKDGVQ